MKDSNRLIIYPNKILITIIVTLLMLFFVKGNIIVNAATVLDGQAVANYLNSRVGQNFANSQCERFVEQSLQNLGVPRVRYCCASKSGNTHIVSNSSTNIPMGATVYFGQCGGGPCKTCGSSYYGHVGIYVGNGMFVHATGGKVQRSSISSSWGAKYRGYGYCMNYSLSNTSPTFDNVWIDPHNHTELMLKTKVTDDVGLRDIKVYYKKTGNADWHSDLMVAQPNGEWWLCITGVDGHGLYDIHIYATDTSGNQAFYSTQTGIDNDQPTVKKVWFDPHNVSEAMLKLDVTDTSGIESVRAYYKRRDKVDWHSELMVAQPNGEWWLYIGPVDGFGDYVIHIYIYDKANNLKTTEISTILSLDRIANNVGQTIADGDYHILSSCTKNKGLDVANGSREKGANVQIYDNLSDSSQVFHIEYLGNGYYKISNKISKLCLDVKDGNNITGTNVRMWEDNSADAQQWVIKQAKDNYNYYIYSKCNGLALDVKDGLDINGTNVRMWEPNNSYAQKWHFIRCGDQEGKTIEDGDYHIISGVGKTRGLDVYSASSADGSNVSIYSNTKDKSQIFHVKYVGDGYYEINNTFTGTYLYLPSSNPYKGTSIVANQYLANKSQKWIIKRSSNSPYYNIIANNGGGYLDVVDGKDKDGTDVRIWSNNGAPAQDWLFIPEEDQTLKANTKDLNAALTWNSLSWADTYDLVITDADGKDFSRKGLKDTSFMDELPAGTYSAYIRSSNEVYSLDSDKITFTTKRSAEDTVAKDITFEGQTFTYDGTAKSLAVTQELPEGIKVHFSGNNQTDAGTYTVTAQFTNSKGQVIDVKSAELVINPKDVSKPGQSGQEITIGKIPDETYTGKKNVPELTIKDGSNLLKKDRDYTAAYDNNTNVGTATVKIIFTGNYTGEKELSFRIIKATNIWNKTLICENVSYGTALHPLAEAAYGEVLYRYASDSTGSYSDQVPADAGTYYVKACVEESENYTALESEAVAVEITKATYDFTDNSFEDATYTYDGGPKSLSVKGQLPLGVEVVYEGNDVADAGEYTVTARFSGDANHEDIPDLTARLTVEPQKVLIPVGYNDLVYNGEEQYGILESELYSVVSGESATEAGQYEATVRLNDKKNFIWEDGTTTDKRVIWTISNAANEWIEELSCPDITYGETPKPTAQARFGNVKYVYCAQEEGEYSGEVPKKYGTWFVKAMVEGTGNYSSLESEPVQFNITAHEHIWDEGKITKEPTCTESGTRTFTCKECGDTRTEVIPATGHTPVKDPAVEPTEDATGLTEGSHCSVCGEALKKQEILPVIPKDLPGVNDSEHETPVDPDDGRKNTGKKNTEKEPGSTKSADPSKPGPSVTKPADAYHPAVEKQEKTITTQKGDGDLKGSDFHTLSARVKKSAKTSNTLAWTKVKGASGYIIYGNQCGSKFRFKKLAEVKGTKWNHKKLKKGTYYKYLVVAYKSVSGGRTVLASSKTIHAATAGGKVGNCKKLTVNKSSVTIKRKKTFTIKAKEIAVSKKLKIKKHRKIAFESGNPKIATVSASGKVKGLKKGSCKIYVYAQNGVCKIVNVRVK